MMKNIQALVLAAGKGTRISAKNKPKVLFPVLGKPMITYVVDATKKIGFKKPLLVIGFQGNKIQELLKNNAEYVWQRRQLGTGHAVSKARDSLKKFDSVLILAGDHPFWRKKTLKNFIKSHQKSKAIFSLMSAVFDDPSFFQYGRIERDKKDHILGIIEQKDANYRQKQIKECNPSLYLIKTDWLFKTLPKIKKSPSGEYYLTDLVALAVQEGLKINVMKTHSWQEAIGINTLEHIKLAEKIFKK